MLAKSSKSQKKTAFWTSQKKMETQFGSYEYVIMVKIPHLPVLCKNCQFHFFWKKTLILKGFPQKVNETTLLAVLYFLCPKISAAFLLRRLAWWSTLLPS